MSCFLLNKENGMSSNTLRAAQILWPAFLMAGVLEMLVFGMVDPSTLRFGDWEPAPNTVYSLTFFLFWALTALAATATQWISGPSGERGGSFGAAPSRRRRRRARASIA